ncbi:27530_t:CDS:1, partial [Gigaspora margarita]
AIQIITPDNINVTVPIVTVTQTLTNAPSPTTLLITQTVIQTPSTNYFNDTNAVNTLIAELITIAISTI